MLIKALKANGVGVLPTDTLYGIGVNAQSEQNIEKIYEFKKREGRKPISIAVADISMIEKIAFMNSSLIEKLIPGPFTFLLSFFASQNQITRVFHFL